MIYNKASVTGPIFFQMKSLRERGDKALKINDFKEAIRYYNEALEIDDKNPDVLLARATACIQMGDYISAQRDTETLINQETENAKVCLSQVNPFSTLTPFDAFEISCI